MDATKWCKKPTRIWRLNLLMRQYSRKEIMRLEISIIELKKNFWFNLEDVETKDIEVLSFDSLDHKAIYIRPLISHRIFSGGDTGVLFVLASTPSDLEDE